MNSFCDHGILRQEELGLFVGVNGMNNLTIELNYLMKYVFYYIGQLLEKVVDDSEEDPQFSAVTLCNLIYCYLNTLEPQTKATMGSIQLFIEEHYCGQNPQEIYSIIERRWKLEREYYIGEQFIT